MSKTSGQLSFPLIDAPIAAVITAATISSWVSGSYMNGLKRPIVVERQEAMGGRGHDDGADLDFCLVGVFRKSLSNISR